MARTRLSSNGRVVIPKAVRDRHGWRPGTELEIEDRGEAVLLRTASAFRRRSVAQVFGCLGYGGPALTIKQMGAAVAREARKSAIRAGVAAGDPGSRPGQALPVAPTRLASRRRSR
jgi:AbrB family looped-hinge helix DNA binding protein